MYLKNIDFLNKNCENKKSMIFKKFFSFIFLLIIIPSNVLAQIDPPIPRGTKIEDLLNSVTNFLYWISFPIATLMIIVAGVMFVTSGGNSERITKAKNLLIYVGIGFLIIVLANGVVELVTEEFGY